MSGPYRRTSWNEIIYSVNLLAVSPPTPSDCEAVGVLEQVPEDHIWTKNDVKIVQDKLIEICDENSFTDFEEDQLWEWHIVLEINAAISKGWCNCNEETCLEQCPNAGEQYEAGSAVASQVIIDLGTCLAFPWGGDACQDLYDQRDHLTGDAYTNADLDAYREAVQAAQTATQHWIQEMRIVGNRTQQIIELESRITTKEAELAVVTENRDTTCAADPGGWHCEQAEALVVMYENELSALIDQKDQAEEDKTEAQNQADTESGTADAQAGLAMTLGTLFNNNAGTKLCLIPLIQSIQMPWGNFYDPTNPLDHPARCRATFFVKSSMYEQWRSYGVGGGYTPNGIPFGGEIWAAQELMVCVGPYDIGGDPGDYCDHDGYSVTYTLTINLPPTHEPICIEDEDEEPEE